MVYIDDVEGGVWYDEV
jgi:hypothetical protein